MSYRFSLSSGRHGWPACTRIGVLVAVTLATSAGAQSTQVDSAPSLPLPGETSWSQAVYFLLTSVVGLASWCIQEYLKRRVKTQVATETREKVSQEVAQKVAQKTQEVAREVAKDWAEGMVKPVKLPPPAKRNSVIMIGLGGTGKTTLIRNLVKDPDANPEKKTEEYHLFHGERRTDQSRHYLYISDYRGQNIGTLVRAFIKQQKIKYSPMAYGHVNSLIVLVDIEEPKQSPMDDEPFQIDEPNFNRVQTHLAQWSGTALDAVFGFLTAETLNYVCLFINKADLLKTREKQAVRALFKELEGLLRERCEGIKFEVYVGSVKEGEQINRLEDDLLEAAVDVSGTDSLSASSTLAMMRANNA